jgi:hypothetical protein
MGLRLDARHATAQPESAAGLDSITAERIRKPKGQPPANLTAYDLYLLAVQGGNTFTKESIAAGIEDATKATALDPDFGRAYAIRARLEYNTIHNSGVD